MNTEIPLARGVPVILQEDPAKRGVCTGIVDGCPHVHWDHDPKPLDLIQHGRCVAGWLRVDASDPIGFGHALCVLRQRGGWLDTTQIKQGSLGWLLHHLDDETTDADRVALDRALAKVSR